MHIKELVRREKYVAIHAQSVRFRIIKYLILFVLAAALWYWKGGLFVLKAFAVLFVVSLFIHFLFRYKTKAWTQSWGPYKKIDIPDARSTSR